MKVFDSEEHSRHQPPIEVFDGGLRIPCMENADRMDRILSALQPADWAEFCNPEDFGLEPVRAVHDPDYIDFLSCWTEWLNSEARDKSVLLPATFALRIRQPAWAGPLSVGGPENQKASRAGGWWTLRREWRDGDVVHVQFTVEPKLVTGTHGKTGKKD